MVDTCRICGAPAETDQPLFHPCKCSGTIRYIHQDWCVPSPVASSFLTVFPVSRRGSLTARGRSAMSASTLTHSPKVSRRRDAESGTALILPPAVYAPNMPSHLPPLLLLRRLIQQFVFAILFVIRVIVVACMWLAVLPWITVWTWRMYFAMGETTCVLCLVPASCRQ